MELACFYAWWILTNGIMQYASFQFLAAAGRASCGLGIGRGPSAGHAAVFFAALRLFHGNLYLAAQQAEAFLLQKRQQGLEAYLALIRKQNQEYTSFQHDIGNHLLVVSELIQGRHYEEAASYAEKLYKSSRFVTEIRSTESPAADVLLREKLGYAGEFGIKTICRVRIPRAFIPYEAELCAILSNLLDNGIMACLKEQKESPFLSIRTREKAGFLFLEVCNSAKARGMIKEGTGLGNVRKIAAAFGGTVDIENSDGIFRVRVLLYLPNTD